MSQLSAGFRALPAAPPAGRLVKGDEGHDDEPAMWVSDGPVTAELWCSLRAAHERSGLWPLLLNHLRGEPRRPWDDGELRPGVMSSPDDFFPRALLAGWWRTYADSARDWPGLSGRLKPRVDPDGHADACTEELLRSEPGLRLGLVAAGRGSDALCAAGWQGAANYVDDTAQLSTVLRSWEERFGVRVLGRGSRSST